MTGRLALAVLVSAVVATTLSATARADGIPSPGYCPPGAQADGCHWAGYCSILDCRDDGTCGDGRVCRELEYCMTTVGCASNPREADAGTFGRDHARSLCSADEPCDGSCEMHWACVHPGDVGEAELSGTEGCTCRAAGRGQGPLVPALCAIVGLAAIGFARRRG